MHTKYFEIELFFNSKNKRILEYIWDHNYQMLLKNQRLNVSIGVAYKEVPRFLKKVTKMLICILEMFYDFECEEGQDLSLCLFGY